MFKLTYSSCDILPPTESWTCQHLQATHDVGGNQNAMMNVSWCFHFWRGLYKHHSITLFSARPNDLIQVQAIFAKSTVPVKGSGRDKAKGGISKRVGELEIKCSVRCLVSSITPSPFSLRGQMISSKCRQFLPKALSITPQHYPSSSASSAWNNWYQTWVGMALRRKRIALTATLGKTLAST